VLRCLIPRAQRIADAPLEQMPQISWGSAVLVATYRGLCSVVIRPTSREVILLGVPSHALVVDPRAVRHRSAEDGPL
jgi:hypothetical protein